MSAPLSSPVRGLADYRSKLPELEAYLTGYWLTDLANFASFVFHSVPDLNWAGFYLHDGTKLLLGPFVGRPACTEIRPGRGVCGTAYSSAKPLLVPNVEDFPGHIVCDSASRSELVLPFAEGVLDLDSPSLARFTLDDQEGVSLWLAALLAKNPALKERPWA
jgi:L-methionine (R)-S-oxide reductase